MIIYEVNLLIDAEIETDYRAWLTIHVNEMLGFKGFTDAEILEDTGEPQAGKTSLSVRYRLRSQEDLDAYLKEHAPRMRAEGQNKFGGRFSASRRVLKPVK